MTKPTAASCAALFAMSTIWCADGSTADLYRSVAANGEQKYASQPWDSSYVLYRQGGSPAMRRDLSTMRRAVARRNHRPLQLAAIERLIDSLSWKYGVDAALVHAVVDVESRFHPHAVSRKGAAGLMQLMPATAARYGVTDPNDAAQNIEAGIRYLKDLLALHNGNIVLALASYNAGEGAVAKHRGRIPPYRETMLYVPAVLVRLQAAQGMHSE